MGQKNCLSVPLKRGWRSTTTAQANACKFTHHIPDTRHNGVSSTRPGDTLVAKHAYTELFIAHSASATTHHRPQRRPCVEDVAIQLRHLGQVPISRNTYPFSVRNKLIIQPSRTIVTNPVRASYSAEQSLDSQRYTAAQSHALAPRSTVLTTPDAVASDKR
eukprot:3903142-Pleurochrysis_carterae.AAC.1